MSCDKKPLTSAVLQLVQQRQSGRRPTDAFHLIAAAQPRSAKRRDATDAQIAAFVADLVHEHDVDPDHMEGLRHVQPRPSPAQLTALRTLLDLNVDDVPVHPASALDLWLMLEQESTAWNALLDLAQRRPQGWTLVGGQMVQLLAWEHGEQPPRTTDDADIVLDVRVNPTALQDVTEHLVTQGFREDTSADGLGHRYRHTTVANASIDVMIPDGIGDTTKFPTTSGARTIEAAGSTQAISRSMRRLVVVNGRSGSVIRPDVFSALVAKAASYRKEPTRHGERHLRDFAFLASLQARHYPVGEAKERMSRGDKKLMTYALEKLPTGHPIWRQVQDGPQARTALADTLV
jgi:hypothetical protein